MDFSKLSPNNMIAGGGGLVSLINIFLPWYGVDFGFGASVTANAFDAGFFAWAGALLAVAGGVLVVLKALGVFEAKVGALTTEQFAMVLAAVGTLFILLKLLFDNDFTKYGLYLGFIAAAATTVGAFLSAKDEGVGLPSADDFKGGGSGGGGSSTF
jgi:hypothetical protein